MISSSMRFRGAVALSAVMLSLVLFTAQRAEAQVSQSAASMVGRQLVDAFTADGPFSPDAPEHLLVR